jgi:hypothetical protein
MRALFDLFLDICLFRKGPQDVPVSAMLLKVCVLAYALSGFVVLRLSTPTSIAIPQILLDVALLTGLLHLTLSLRRHPQRFGQTLSALTGVGVLMALLALPLMIWIVQQGSDGDAVLPSMLLLGLMGWSIAIMAHILRHALNIPLWVSAVYAVGYTFLSWTMTGWIG